MEKLQNFCRAFNCEAIIRYDLQTDDWYGHLYSVKRSRLMVDKEFRGSTYVEVARMLMNEASRQRMRLRSIETR